jgi:hypothetical protein
MIRKFTISLSFVFLFTYTGKNETPKRAECFDLKQETTVKKKNAIKISTPEKVKCNRNFCKLLSTIESGRDFTIVNGKFIGKYQFGPRALEQVDCPVNIEDFKSNPEIFDSKKQDSVLFLLLKWNKKILKPYIKRYEGQEIKGVIVTRAGILAAAHLGGAGNIMKFLKSNGEEDFKDGNGVPVSRYLKKFEKHQIHLEHYL